MRGWRAPLTPGATTPRVTGRPRPARLSGRRNDGHTPRPGTVSDNPGPIAQLREGARRRTTHQTCTALSAHPSCERCSGPAERLQGGCVAQAATPQAQGPRCNDQRAVRARREGQCARLLAAVQGTGEKSTGFPRSDTHDPRSIA